MQKKTVSIEEFELEAPIHMVIEILYEGRWLIVHDYDCHRNYLIIESDDENYRVEEPITVCWSIDED